MYQKTLAKWHFWLTMIGSNVTFIAMLLLGYGGMPRRYATYLPQFTDLHVVATVGAFIMGFGQLIFVYNLVVSWLEGPRVESGDPWDLEEDGMKTHEWAWFERKRETALAIADGGETVTADGGERDAVSRTSKDERRESSGSEQVTDDGELDTDE
jgi:cytochrome c oxidase subunit 1